MRYNRSMRRAVFFSFVLSMGGCSSGPGDVGTAPGDDTGSPGKDSSIVDSLVEDSGSDATKDDTSVTDTRPDVPSSDGIASDGISSDVTFVDSTPVEAGKVCGDTEPKGTCPDGGLSCQCCPAGGAAQHCICTTSCFTDLDCKDSARPKCEKESVGVKGFCKPLSLTCCWLCG